MRIFLSLSIFLFSSLVFAECRFKNHVSKVFSFSGVTSVALKEMGLLKNPVVKGISLFNPVALEDFSGKRWPGGIYLSPKSFAEIGGGIVFYDESKDLEKILSPMSSIQGVEIKTRGLEPVRVTEDVLGSLDAFIEGCDVEKKNFLKKTKNLSARILALIKKQKSVVYYLGEFRNGHPPEMILVNDGIAKWLLREKKIITYPSPLSYVSWSTKIMSKMPADTQHIAINDSEAAMTKSVKRENEHVTLTYPGALVPGYSQLEAWLYLEENNAN